MITVNVLTSVSTGHRLDQVSVADSGHVLAFSRQGRGSLLAPDHTVLASFSIPAPRTVNCAISPKGDLIAASTEEALLLLRAPGFEIINRLEGPFPSGQFAADGSLLWSVVEVGNGASAFEIRDTSNWRLVASTEVSHPFERPSFSFFPCPGSQRIAVWAASGQGDACLYWADYDGRELSVQRAPGFDDSAPPSFNASGTGFLSVCGDEVRHYQYPEVSLRGAMSWPFEDDPIGMTVAFFAGENHALIDSNSGRLFLIDLHRMTIVDEVCVPGHEPKPLDELFPELSHEPGLGSDLGFFAPVPNGRFLSVHEKLPSRGIFGQRDLLLTWELCRVNQ